MYHYLSTDDGCDKDEHVEHKKWLGEKKDLTSSVETFTALHSFCNAVFFISSFLKSSPCVQGGRALALLAAVRGRFTASTQLSVLNRRRLPIC